MAVTNKVSPDKLPFPRLMLGYNPDDGNFYALKVDGEGQITGITATIGEARIYVWDGAAWQKAKADSDGHLHVDIESSALPAGAATEATLATLATDAKLELVRLLLVSLDGKDFAGQATLSELNERIGDETSPLPGTVNKQLSHLLIELGLKADLTETQPVSAASLPLPTGAATEATLATLATDAKLELVRLLLASIDGKDFATQTTLAALLTELQAKADLTETQPVSAAALPLPTGAATEATLATLATEAKLELVRLLLASIDAKDFATQTTLAALLTELQAKADLSETQPVSAAALPLPTGAATAANQATEITALQLIDDLRNALGSVNTDDLQVDVKTSALPTGAATAANQATMITALQLIDDLRNALDSIGADELDVNVESSVLPTGAATQTTLAIILTELQRMKGRVVSVGSVHEAFTATAANHLRDIFTVPAGDTVVITSLIAKDNTNALTEINIALYNGTDWLCVSGKNAPAQYETVEAKTPIVIPAGWHVGSWFRGATIGDTLQTDLIYYMSGT